MSQVRRLPDVYEILCCLDYSKQLIIRFIEMLLKPHSNCLQLKSPINRPLKTRAEAFAAFNLALNAFARGNRRTAIELLQAVLTLKGLPGG